jgi:hypothetical protein
MPFNPMSNRNEEKGFTSNNRNMARSNSQAGKNSSIQNIGASIMGSGMGDRKMSRDFNQPQRQ